MAYMKKRNLTKQAICEAAIQLIEADGLVGLSMRKLASKLKVEAASLYNHFIKKSELFDHIQEHLYSQIPINLSETNWKSHLIELAQNTRFGLLQVPQVALLFATRPTITASSLKQAEATLNILMKAGFKPSEVLSIYRNLHVFVLGHVLAEVGQVPGEKDESLEPSLKKINIDSYPALKKSASYQSNIDFEKGFKLGLHCMINGLEKLLTRKAR
jgi:AcrR family transcriptional regulator